ncbi:MAG: fumarylacetoacetate hydrolase family protein, partial [Haloechinothrix sp.]
MSRGRGGSSPYERQDAGSSPQGARSAAPHPQQRFGVRHPARPAKPRELVRHQRYPGPRGASDEPLLFLKPAASVIGPGEEVVHPGLSRRLDPETELVLVIGR